MRNFLCVEKDLFILKISFKFRINLHRCRPPLSLKELQMDLKYAYRNFQKCIEKKLRELQTRQKHII